MAREDAVNDITPLPNGEAGDAGADEERAAFEGRALLGDVPSSSEILAALAALDGVPGGGSRGGADGAAGGAASAAASAGPALGPGSLGESGAAGVAGAVGAATPQVSMLTSEDVRQLASSAEIRRALAEAQADEAQAVEGQVADLAPGEAAAEDDAALAEDGSGGPTSSEPSDQPDFPDDASGVLPGEPEEPPRASRKSCLRRAVVTLVVVLVVAAVAVASLFSWNRWGRYDDHADMQGEWYVEGTAVPVSIDAGAIHLSDSVAYKYAIDDREKTISYAFGNWEGQGRYWFSDDRAHLVLTDGDFDGAATTVDDFAQAFQGLVAQASGGTPELPSGEGTVALSREPDPQALAEQEKAQKAAASKAKARAAEADAEGEEGEEGEADEEGGADEEGAEAEAAAETAAEADAEPEPEPDETREDAE